MKFDKKLEIIDTDSFRLKVGVGDIVDVWDDKTKSANSAPSTCQVLSVETVKKEWSVALKIGLYSFAESRKFFIVNNWVYWKFLDKSRGKAYVFLKKD